MRTNGDPNVGIFLFYLNMNNGHHYFLFQNKFPEVPEYAKMQFHFNITMTSLDDHVREFQ